MGFDLGSKKFTVLILILCAGAVGYINIFNVPHFTNFLNWSSSEDYDDLRPYIELLAPTEIPAGESFHLEWMLGRVVDCRSNVVDKEELRVNTAERPWVARGSVLMNWEEPGPKAIEIVCNVGGDVEKVIVKKVTVLVTAPVKDTLPSVKVS